MASRYPVRSRDPVRRFGYDDVDLDASDDNELNENNDDNIVQASSDEFSSSSDEDEGTFSGEANLWKCVDLDSDEAPDIAGFQTQNVRHAGWQNINSDAFTVEMYIDQFLPTELFDLLAQWTNSRARIDEAEKYLNDEDNFQWKEVDADTMKTFIALTLLTGIVKKSVMKSYWQPNLCWIPRIFGHA